MFYEKFQPIAIIPGYLSSEFKETFWNTNSKIITTTKLI